MENAYAVSRFLLSGSGGQGVITMAILLAEAAVKYEGLVAVQSQSYGPEARGGAARSDVILSHKAIYRWRRARVPLGERGRRGLRKGGNARAVGRRPGSSGPSEGCLTWAGG